MRRSDDPELYIASCLKLLKPVQWKKLAGQHWVQRDTALDELAKVISDDLKRHFELKYKTDWHPGHR